MAARRTVITGMIVWAALLLAVFLVPELIRTRADTMLEYGEPAKATLSPSAREVTYTFQGTAGDKLRIVANATDGVIDPFISLYNPSGRLIGEDDNGGGKINALLSGVVLPEDGVYRLVVSNLKADTGEVSVMVMPEQLRGVAALYEGVQYPQAYQLSQPWERNDLTYAVYNTLPGFSEADTLQVIAEAFEAWASVTPLTFTQVSDNADILIEFASIDGPSNVLGQACPPSSPCAGQVQFDSDEAWTLRQPRGWREISFLGVATHEFGHIIGLLHSNDTNALMYAAYSPYNLQPSADDVRGAQRLYGSGRGGVNAGGPAMQPPSNGAAGGEAEVTGEVTNTDYVDFWDFDVQAGETITITMEAASGNLDPFLVLLDANNNILAYADDIGESLNAQLADVRLPSTGVYTVAATRYEQAQGYTQGQYRLRIDYGGTGGTTSGGGTGSVPPAAGDASVRASRGLATDLQRYQQLDAMLDKQFTERVRPSTETRTATVRANETYAWSLSWCAVDEATLNENRRHIRVSFAIDGQPVDPGLVTETAPRRERVNNRDLSCVDYFTLLSGWTPGTVRLTRTMTFTEAVFDGFQVYAPGDYVNEYDVSVR